MLRAVRVSLDTVSDDALSRVRFTAAAVVAHADPDVRAILERADCTRAHSLGKLFSRCEGHAIDGHVLVRLALSNQGLALAVP